MRSLLSVFLFAVLCGSLSATSSGNTKIGGKLSPAGAEIQIDLPESEQSHNERGSDKLGLCVFASISHAARWANVKVLEDFCQWMTRYPGGGDPAKVDQKIAQICKERGVAKPQYIQLEGNDIEPIKEACKFGRMACVTYYKSPSGRYDGQPIMHMVNVVHCDDEFTCVLDNNFIGVENYEWMRTSDFKQTFVGRRSGWLFVLLGNGPPPPPCN